MSVLPSFPKDHAITVRPSYTAEFLISSQDRLPGLDTDATNFTLGGGLSLSTSAGTSNGYKVGYGGSVSLYNGEFNRMALTELDMQWAVENVSGQLWGNNELSVTASVGGAVAVTYDISIVPGFYNVAECLEALVYELNYAIGSTEFQLIAPSTLTGGQVLLAMKSFNSSFFVLPGSPLAQQLGLPSLIQGQAVPVIRPNLMPIQYVDFTCRQLTDNMSLKDGNTSASGQSTSVISRWYFAPQTDVYDSLGFLILQGYAPFTSRRTFAYPKEMKWDPKMPIGQLSFQVKVPTNWRPDDNVYKTYYTTNSPQQGNGTVLDLNLVYNEAYQDGNPYSSPIFSFNMKLLVSET